jgi:hypothetical protein
MSNDDINSQVLSKPSLTRAQKRALFKEFGWDKPMLPTKSVVNARKRAMKWRDDRHDAGLPDNRIISSLAFRLLLGTDAQKRADGKAGLDSFFQTLLDQLPTRFDRDGTKRLLDKFREDADRKLNKT